MQVTDEMVHRFLNWRLPENFSPDAGITFKPFYNEHMPFGPMKHEPTGTNLLDATQARAMLEHVLQTSEPKARELPPSVVAAIIQTAWDDKAPDVMCFGLAVAHHVKVAMLQGEQK